MSNDWECPYCGEENEHCGDPISPLRAIELECDKCNKVYYVNADYCVTYYASKER